MTKTIYCVRCRKSHTEDEMQLVSTKIGLQWRCKKGIEAQKKTTAERDAFGKQISAANRKKTSEKQLGKIAKGPTEIQNW